jgi:hypothetical protein
MIPTDIPGSEIVLVDHRTGLENLGQQFRQEGNFYMASCASGALVEVSLRSFGKNPTLSERNRLSQNMKRSFSDLYHYQAQLNTQGAIQ